jgi:hypothetical protein
MGYYLVEALKASGHDAKHFWLRDALKIPKDFDLYFRVDNGDYATADLPLDLKPRVFYAVDTHLSRSRKHMEAFLASYDAIFCAQYLTVSGWQKLFKNVFWVPLGCDPNVHKQLYLDEPKKYDLGFVGSMGGIPRKFILQSVWERYAKNSFFGKYGFLELSEIYSRAKIGFNYSIQNDINMRIFEVMSCGAMLMTNAITDPMLHQLYEEDKDLVLYRDFDDLCQKVEYYLAHPQKCQEIAKRGQAKTLEKHTYQHRTDEMLKIAQSLCLFG